MFTIILIAVLVVLTIYFLQFLYKHHGTNKRLKGFVSPPGLPLLKHFFLFSSELKLLPNLLDVSRKYGGLVKVELCYGVPLLVVTDSNLASYILSSYKHLQKDTFYELAESWVGTGLVTCQPDKWRKTRKIMNPAFNTQILEGHIKSFEYPSKVLVERLKKEIGRSGFNILHYLTLCTLDILAETIMNVKLNLQENSNAQYLTDVKEEAAIVVRRLFSPIKRNQFLYMFTSDYWKERSKLKRIHGFTNDVINNRKKIKAMEMLNSNGANHASNNGLYHTKIQRSLVDILLDATYNERPMTNREIMDEVQSFLFGGHDTTAMSVSLVLYCLSKHLDVQDYRSVSSEGCRLHIAIGNPWFQILEIPACIHERDVFGSYLIDVLIARIFSLNFLTSRFLFYDMWTALIFCYHLKKTAAESHPILIEVYREHALGKSQCFEWFNKFKSGDFDVRNEERGSPPRKFEVNEFQSLLDEHDTQMQQQFADQSNVVREAISIRLKAMGKIQKMAKWFPHELNERQ